MATDDPETIHLPFWRVEAEIPHLNLHTIEDLMRLANRTYTPAEHQEEPLCFYLPAFTVQPRFFLQLSRVLTLGQVGSNTSDSLPKQPHPVTLQGEKVLKMLPMLMAELCSDKRGVFPELPLVEPKVKGISLLFLPFKERGYQAVFQGEFTYAIPCNALRWGIRL